MLYAHEDLHIASGENAFISFFSDNNMSCTFSECVTVLKIIVIISMMTVENERYFSTIKIIKKIFLRNSIATYRLNALAMLPIEKNDAE